MTSPSVDRRFGLNSSTAIKAPCRVAATANLTLSGLQTVDGVSLSAGDRVLVAGQTNSIQNGIYVADTGAWQRDTDFNDSRDVSKGTIGVIMEGSYQDQFWMITTSGTIRPGSTAISIVVGVPPYTFTQSGSGAIARPILDKLRESVSFQDFGAIGDGNSHPLSTRFATLSAAQAVYSFATNLTDEIDWAAIQAGINYSAAGHTICDPGGYVYLVNRSLTMANGMKIVGNGDPTGTAASAIKVNTVNYTNASFRMFVKPSGLFQSAIFEGIRFLGGGNHFYFDLSTGSAYKIKWDNCVFQDAVGSHIYCANSASGNGLLVCRHRGCSVINSGGIFSSGPINATEISGGSWENMRGPVLYVSATGSFPNLKFTLSNNRIEGLYSGVAESAFPVIQLDGQTYGAEITDNYFENTFTNQLQVTNSRGIVFARNTHTDSDLTVATITASSSQVSIYDNYSLVGGTVTFSGTSNSLPRCGANQGWSIVSLYGKTTTADDPVFLGSGGISLEGYPALYKGQTNKLKIISVPATTATYVNLFQITSGSSAVLGSRAVISIRATLLLSVIDSTAGSNLMMSQELLITVWANAGGTMSSSIAVLGSTTSPAGTNFTVRQQAGASTTALTIECAVTNAALAYISSSKIIASYSYVADENASSGLSIS